MIPLKKHRTVKGPNHIISMLLLASFFMAWLPEAHAERKVTDQRISEAINKELLLHSDVPAYLIDITTVDGVVTLSGSVDNMLAKERAEEVAMAVKGVRGVINRLSVETAFITDETVEGNAQEALINDPATESYEIDVQVDEGIATLTGQVDSWQEKQLSAYVVKGVKGIQGIRNNIRIDYDEKRTDKEIAEEIRGLLDNDIRVDNALLEVEVNDGRVKLSGTVGSLSEKKQAEVDAWVIGVKTVNVEDVNVKHWARNENLRKETERTDEEIKNAVNDVFLYDPRVNSYGINVRAENGVVTLTGQVDNLKAKNAARRDAKNVVGVFSVKDLIDVRPSIIPNDEDLKEDVKNAVIKDPYVERFDINYYVHNGKVVLSGEVNSYFEKFHAEEVVSKVKGVVTIDNNLNVQQDMAEKGTYSYEYYGWNTVYPSLYTVYEEETANKSDWEIKNDIADQLWWSPFVDKDEVNVKVKDAKATLSGVVDSYDEKAAASQNAYEGGAIAVENNIIVEDGPYYKGENQ